MSLLGAPGPDFSGPGAIEARFIPHAVLPQQASGQSPAAGNCSFDIARAAH